MSVNHPRHRPGNAIVSRNLDSVTVLTKGLTVTGRVVDGAGRPVKGASAVIGHDTWGGSGPPKGTTNEQGEFTLENCDAGPTIVTVQAEGFAPSSATSRSRSGPRPLSSGWRSRDQRFASKSSTSRASQSPELISVADTWRTHRSIHFRAETGPDGRVEWRSAPKDEVLYDIGNSTYMWSREVPLTASEREQTVILHPKLVISGRVTDAETGRPVPAFRVVQGQQDEERDQIDWSENASVDVQGGQYTSRFGEPGSRFSSGWRLRVTSRPSRGPFFPPRARRPSTSPSNVRRGSPGSSFSRMASRRREPRSRWPWPPVEVSDLAFGPIAIAMANVPQSDDRDGRTIHVSTDG